MLAIILGVPLIVVGTALFVFTHIMSLCAVLGGSTVTDRETHAYALLYGGTPVALGIAALIWL